MRVALLRRPRAIARGAALQAFAHPKHVDVRKHARRRRVADADRLRRLALAAMRCPQHLHRAGIADPREAPPEVRADAAVIGILDHRAERSFFDQAAALAAELELVARVVDRPRAIGLHQHAVLDARDHLGERRVAGLEVQVRHPVDRRPVPAVGARVRRPGQPRARLRNRAAERSLQDAVLDHVHFLGLRALVIPAVARELLRAGRVERDVQQIGTVAIGAEHVGCDEGRAGVVALVAEDAVELERMADRLVDLQDHLVGQEQHVHRAARAVRRGDELECLGGQPPAGADEAEAREDFVAALLAYAAIAVQRAGLRVAVRVRGDRDPREQEAVTLDDIAASAGDQAMRCRAHVDARVPVDDPRIDRRVLRLPHQQLEPLAARAHRGFERGRRILAARCRARQAPRVEQRPLRGSARPRCSARKRRLDARGRRIAGGRVAVAAVRVDGRHRAAVAARERRQGDVLAHGVGLARLIDDTQRPEVGAAGERGKVGEGQAVGIGHSGLLEG